MSEADPTFLGGFVTQLHALVSHDSRAYSTRAGVLSGFCTIGRQLSRFGN